MRYHLMIEAALVAFVAGTTAIAVHDGRNETFTKSTTLITRPGSWHPTWTKHNATISRTAVGTGPSRPHITASGMSDSTISITANVTAPYPLAIATLQPSLTNASQTTSYSYGLLPDSTASACDYSNSYTDLAAMGDLYASQPRDCVADYTLDTLINMLNATSNNYTKNVNNGYDDDFQYYVTYMKDYVPDEIENHFMIQWADFPPPLNPLSAPVGPGMNYFDCSVPGEPQFPCSALNDTGKFESMSGQTTTLTLRDSSGFYSALEAVGIAEDWVMWQDKHEIQKKGTTVDKKLRRSPTNIGIGNAAGIITTEKDYTFLNWPVQNQSMVVFNPKDVITDGIGSLSSLQTSMQATLMESILGMWSNGTTSSPSQVYSMPVFMFMSAVDNMAQAKAIAVKEKQKEEADAEARKNFILLIISVFLMVVPVVGEDVAMGLELANVARVISIGGELGNAAMDLYNVIDSSGSDQAQNALFAVFGRLFGIGKFPKIARSGKDMDDLADSRKAISLKDIDSFGPLFKQNNELLQRMLSACFAGARTLDRTVM